jgi:hypothetical protein
VVLVTVLLVVQGVEFGWWELLLFVSGINGTELETGIAGNLLPSLPLCKVGFDNAVEILELGLTFVVAEEGRVELLLLLRAKPPSFVILRLSSSISEPVDRCNESNFCCCRCAERDSTFAPEVIRDEEFDGTTLPFELLLLLAWEVVVELIVDCEVGELVEWEIGCKGVEAGLDGALLLLFA